MTAMISYSHHERDVADAMIGHLWSHNILNDGVTKNEFVVTEVLMAEAMGIPVFMAFNPEIRAAKDKIAIINSELRQGDLAFRRIFDRNAFIVQSQPPLASDDVVHVLKKVVHPARGWRPFRR